MQLTITTTHRPATDLGYLLHKNPGRVQSFAQSFGQAHVLYPEAAEERCTVALLLDIDAVGLVRMPHDSGGFALEQYVNDRPYVASSFLSVALGEIFGSAMASRCKDRPELAEQAIPLEATIGVVACQGGDGLLHRLFESLGYTVHATGYPLDPRFPEWGASPYYTLTLRGVIRLRDLLTHIYVLMPVLDNDKHYWVGDDEVEKLLRRGEGWLATHPERELIAARYLRNHRSLARDALARLAGLPDPGSPACPTPTRRPRAVGPTRVPRTRTSSRRQPRNAPRTCMSSGWMPWLPCCGRPVPNASWTWAAARAGG